MSKGCWPKKSPGLSQCYHHYADAAIWGLTTTRTLAVFPGPGADIPQPALPSISFVQRLDALGQGPAFPGFWPEHIFKEGGEFLVQMHLKGFWDERFRDCFSNNYFI